MRPLRSIGRGVSLPPSPSLPPPKRRLRTRPQSASEAVNPNPKDDKDLDEKDEKDEKEEPAKQLIPESSFFSGISHFACPFPLCNDALDQSSLLNPHKVLDHLASVHRLCVCRRTQVMPYLDWYLVKWGGIMDDHLIAKSHPQPQPDPLTEDEIDCFSGQEDEDDLDDDHDMYSLSDSKEHAQPDTSILYEIYNELQIPFTLEDVSTYKSFTCTGNPTSTTPASTSHNPSQLQPIYHLGHPNTPTDLYLRHSLHKNKLTSLLTHQKTSLHTSPPPPRKCIFYLFTHMHQEHSFHLGNPLNLIDVDTLFTELEAKMAKGVCIYCEGVFPDTVVLRRHMRKKRHFKVNPWNCEYDRFYLINYSDFEGRRWLDYDEDDEMDEDKRGQEELGDWEDWHADLEDLGGEGTMCLFEDVMLPNVQEAVEHLETMHGFSLKGIKREYALTEYGIIRLINYIRGCTAELTCFGCQNVFPTMEDLSVHYGTSGHHISGIPVKGDPFWREVEHLFPSYEGDPLLTWDCEDEDED
ncbi:hypothetical protein BCR33DRAFT_712683 [Rhizoclosmatium globosum]|uniref:C2H2-type domain-containing protein n=1 Tax=Rhizoclosmatium globosum TaxID=329046 RepID=A0A1Y2CXB7_9FUNG|nr:hypothetical protein BCR33DRAFT_712683 [Rhizoclosmatium globosum]|eukprot:ORY51672.1 hypothetical protein BCR33DRAFT_712683 [Rhizoclosmatium globosum]